MKSKKILIGLGLFLLTIILCSFINQELLSNLLEKLIFNAVSILVGLSIAIVGIFLSSINTIYLSIYKILKIKDQQVFSEEEISTIKSQLSDLVDELKSNALFSLFAFLIILLLFFFKEIDIPYVSWFIQSAFLTKTYMIHFLITFGNFLIFWAIIDSVKVVFDITKAFELIRDDE